MSTAVTRRRGSRRRRSTRGASKTGDSIGQYASDAWSLAKRTAIGLNEIRKFINIETKSFDTSGTGTFDYNGSLSAISTIAQGLDVNNRVGDSIRLQRVEWRGTFNTDTGAVTTAVRVLVFRDLDGAGTAPAVTDVLQTTGSVNSVNSPYNRLNLDRFSILFDETSTLSNVGQTQVVMAFEAQHQGHIKYLGTAAAAASNGRGTMYTILICDRVTTLLPTGNQIARIYYTDD